jgi:hypothetical protein
MDNHTKIVIILFIAVLAIRLWFAFDIPNFTYDSYFHLRQAAHIQQKGIPLYEDPLSYGGRSQVFLPLYDYLLAIGGYLLPLETATKYIANILIALLVPLTFLIAKEIASNKTGAVLASFIAGFIPITFETNSATPLTLTVPLTFLAIYFITRIRERKYTYFYLATFIVLSFTSALTALFIWGLLIYLIISKIDDEKELKREELEITLFSLFAFIWIQFLFFKNVLLHEGIGFLWQNIPSPILSSYFQRLSIGESAVYLGILPLVTGFWVMYKNLFRQHNRFTNLLISFALGILILLVFQAILLKTALVFLGVTFAILFARFYHLLDEYVKKTKVDRYRQMLPWMIVIIIIITSVSPSFAYALQQETPTENDVYALQWIYDYTPANSTVVSTVDEGHLVNYVAQRKNVMDSAFVGIPDVDERFKDIERIFVTRYQTEAIDLIDKYSIDYILVSENARRVYGIDRLQYLKGGCFRHVYKNVTQVYKAECTLEEIMP